MLLATEREPDNDIEALAVARDGDWKDYCQTSDNLDYIEDFADALSKFNKETAPFAFLSLSFISKLESNKKMMSDLLKKFVAV